MTDHALLLEWLDGQDLKDCTVLDFGCGSGILAIAAMLLESTGDGSHTPTSKFVAICLEPASPSALIMAKAS